MASAPSLLQSLRSRRLAWLLALSLWLPVAQWASATHALLHLHASISDERDAVIDLPGACELCVVAAVVSGGSPLPTPAAFTFPAAVSPAPAVDIRLPVARLPVLAYRSRAPPALHA